MQAIAQRKFEELKGSPAMPSPDGVALEIARIALEENVPISRIVTLVQSDPALAGRLIHLANSAGIAGSRRIASVQEAVNRLGLRSVRNAALGLSLMAGRHAHRCEGFDYPRFWTRSLACGIAAKAVATARRLMAPDEFFTLGLLSEIGQLALASVYPDEYATVLRRSTVATPGTLLDLEQEVFAIDHAQITAAMLTEWQFPAPFVEIALHQGHPASIALARDSRIARGAEALGLAAAFADFCVADDTGRGQLAPRVLELGNHIEFGEAEVITLTDTVVGEWREWGRILNVATRPVPPISEYRRSALADKSTVAPDSAAAATIGSTAGVIPVPPPGTTSAAPSSNSKPVPSTDPSSNPPSKLTARSGAAGARTLKILVVDDDSNSRRVLEMMLKAAGYAVTMAVDGHDALERITRDPPEIIITDWEMPVLDGMGLCRALRATPTGRLCYIVVLTAHGDEARLAEAFASGADEYLTKPLRRGELLARLHAGERIVKLEETLLRESAELRKVAAELALANRRLESFALTDVLTGIPNRRCVLDRLEQEFSAAARDKSELAVLMVDIDHFKRVNDTLGHAEGDRVLREVAQALRRNSRLEDTVGRFGGEEFLVVCPGLGMAAGAALAERLREAVEHAKLDVVTEFGPPTVSVGLAGKRGDDGLSSKLLERADAALYEAKRGGRNRVKVG